MNVTISPSALTGAIQAPTSKSSMQRACAAALLHKGITVIHNPGFSNDDKAAMEVIQKLGASIEIQNSELKVISNGVNPENTTINTGESGLGVRMFTPIAALSEKPIIISGHGSLMERPMDFFDEILPKLGVTISSNHGKLPMQIQGPLQPATITIDGSLSSQFLTGLLMAYAAANARDVSINVNQLKSRPYVDLTLAVMKSFGMKVPQNKNYEAFYFDASTPVTTPSVIEYTVEGDWSGGAFLLVAAAIAGEVKVQGLLHTSTQADKKIIKALQDAGAEVSILTDAIYVKKNKLEAFYFDATDCPDLFPPLVALAANCKGVSQIKGLKRLKHKESDRGLTLKEEFEKLNTPIELKEDEMLVHGNGEIVVKNSILYSHNDHRIAMAVAIAGLTANQPIHIRKADAINKSYPDFYHHLRQLGVQLMEANDLVNQ